MLRDKISHDYVSRCCHAFSEEILMFIIITMIALFIAFIFWHLYTNIDGDGEARFMPWSLMSPMIVLFGSVTIVSVTL